MEIKLTVDRSAPGTGFKSFWRECVGAGRANEGLRADWQQHLKLAVTECGFKRVRFHGLFHDDMFTCRREPDGTLAFNWQYVDTLFDRMIELGVRPFVELGFCPGDLARTRGTVFWWKGNGAPPVKLEEWAELVSRFVRHLVGRYGLNEIRTWYFEVWNEPNLWPFFHGKRSEYFELYRAAALAVKAVDPQLKVGGPATSNFVPDERFDGELEDTSRQMTFKVDDLNTLEWHGVWIEAFLDFCNREKLPVDFVSAHPYPTDFALDGHGASAGRSRHVDSTREDLRWLRRTVDASAFPDAEIHLTEWSSSPTPRDPSHDWLPAACFVLKANLDSINLVDSLSYWVFTDVFEEGGCGFGIFHGGFGLINLQGIPKPAFHAYRFLNALGSEATAHTEGAFVSRRPDGKLAAVLWNYPAETVPEAVPITANHDEAERMMHTGAPKRLAVTLTGFVPGARIAIETLDRNHGVAVAKFRAIGAPAEPLPSDIALLKEAAATKKEVVTIGADGVLALTGELAPWECRLIREL